MLSSHIAVLIEKVPWVYGAILYNSQGHLWQDMLVYLKKKKKKKKGRWGINTNLKVCLTVALNPM